MSTQNRRSSFSSSTMSSLAKRTSSSSSLGNPAKENAVNRPNIAKKRAPLGDVTNRRAPLSNFTNQKHNESRSTASSCDLVHCSNKISQPKKVAKPVSSRAVNSGISTSDVPAKSNPKPSIVASHKATTPNLQISKDTASPTIPASSHAAVDVSPYQSDQVSVSMDESMSTCDSFKSPEVEYMDNSDALGFDSVERKCFSNICISKHAEPDDVCGRSVGKDDKIVNIDSNFVDPQLCATFACDIYQHLRASEVKKRPSQDFMEKIQKDINASMRAILIDWLVEVAEEYRLVSETLYLTVNYIDRYLSGNAINRQRLQLLGVTCMMIAAKYEEICPPQVEEFCYITDNTYFKDEVLQMESSVLNYLKFELTAPTAKCFLRRFVRAAQGKNEVLPVKFECLAGYLTELSLLEYTMLRYVPSLIAASAVFLANYMLDPSRKPWNSTLEHYTFYRASDLKECVKDLHRLCCNCHSSGLPAVREKYSQHKYKFVAKKFCPASVPLEFFLDY